MNYEPIHKPPSMLSLVILTNSYILSFNHQSHCFLKHDHSSQLTTLHCSTWLHPKPQLYLNSTKISSSFELKQCIHLIIFTFARCFAILNTSGNTI